MAQQPNETDTLRHGQVLVNGQVFDNHAYLAYHQRRIACTIQKLRHMGAKKIVEVGSNPWMMTAALIDTQAFDVCATISAEEVTHWPDDIGVVAQRYCIHTAAGNEASMVNYAANIERTHFELSETPDSVVACEIVEHLLRSPHVMFLNINHWLPMAGKLLLTTPNGAQFANPLRRRSPTPAYRCNIYERHAYLYTLDDLVELLTLCGFRIVEGGYWSVYERRGLAALYKACSYLPWKYCQDKFGQTIFLVCEKEKDVALLDQIPSVYDPRGDWEFCQAST